MFRCASHDRSKQQRHTAKDYVYIRIYPCFLLLRRLWKWLDVQRNAVWLIEVNVLARGMLIGSLQQKGCAGRAYQGPYL